VGSFGLGPRELEKRGTANCGGTGSFGHVRSQRHTVPAKALWPRICPGM